MYAPLSWSYVLCKVEVCSLRAMLTCESQLDFSPFPLVTLIQESNSFTINLVLEVNMPVLLIAQFTDPDLSPPLLDKKLKQAGLHN